MRKSGTIWRKSVILNKIGACDEKFVSIAVKIRARESYALLVTGSKAGVANSIRVKGQFHNSRPYAGYVKMVKCLLNFTIKLMLLTLFKQFLLYVYINASKMS